MIAAASYVELRELAGPPTWVRGEATVADGWVELTSRETYEPCAPHVGAALLFSLASLRGADDAIAFAGAFGLLFGAESHRERLSDWLIAARSLRGALTLYAHLQPAADGDEAALEKLRGALRDFRRMHGARVEAELDAYGTTVDQAAILVAEIVNAALPPQQLVASALLEQREDGHDIRLAGTQPAFFFRPGIENLVGLAHHMLALMVANRVHVRVCEGCPVVFVPDRPDQLHHNPGCANRARQARHRARRAAAGGEL